MITKLKWGQPKFRTCTCTMYSKYLGLDSFFVQEQLKFLSSKQSLINALRMSVEHAPVVVGYVDPVPKKYRKDTLGDCCISRIGGPPAFLKSAPAFDKALLKCPQCSQLMALLLQLFAPETEDRPQAIVRLIYVFTCWNGKCSEQGWSRSFKVFRSQSTGIDVQLIESEEREFPLLEITSEAEPEGHNTDASTSSGKTAKKGIEAQHTIVENDGSEKYVKVKGDTAFYKFNKRLGIAPEQILRYLRASATVQSSDALTLWISDKGKLADKDIPACEHCKGQRSIEFQIMPTLLSYLDLDDAKADTLDWGVLNVYTCNEACNKANEVFVEEKLYRQEYDMKTSIF